MTFKACFSRIISKWVHQNAFSLCLQYCAYNYKAYRFTNKLSWREEHRLSLIHICYFDINNTLFSTSSPINTFHFPKKEIYAIQCLNACYWAASMKIHIESEQHLYSFSLWGYALHWFSGACSFGQPQQVILYWPGDPKRLAPYLRFCCARQAVSQAAYSPVVRERLDCSPFFFSFPFS